MAALSMVTARLSSSSSDTAMLISLVLRVLPVFSSFLVSFPSPATILVTFVVAASRTALSFTPAAKVNHWPSGSVLRAELSTSPKAITRLSLEAAAVAPVSSVTASFPSAAKVPKATKASAPSRFLLTTTL